MWADWTSISGRRGRRTRSWDKVLCCSQVSPYTTLADWVNIHGNSGLRIKIPKPIYFNVKIEVNVY